MFEPLWGVLEITDKCNLYCRHCSGEKRNIQEDLSFSKWRKIISGLKLNGCFHITLSGGEPLLNKDIYKIIHFSKERGIETTVTSNGILIDKTAAKRLAESKADGVQISVDGFLREHEFLRGKGTFSRAINAIKLLNAEGINCSTMTVVSSLNRKILGHLVRYFSKLQVSHMGFERLTPVGRGKRLKKFILSALQIKAVFQELQKFSKSYPVKVNDPLRILTDPQLRKFSRNKDLVCAGCLSGIATCAVSSGGDLKLCTRIRYKLGNLLREDFQTLWREDPVARRLRNRDINHKCVRCSYRFACGGCRAEAQSSAKDIFAEDPGCWIKERR